MKKLYRSKEFVISMGALVFIGCSDARLYKGQAGVASADINFCTTAPNAVTSKLKYIFVVDQSSYNQANYIIQNPPTNSIPTAVPTIDPNGGNDPTGNIRYLPLINFLNTAQPSPTTFYS